MTNWGLIEATLDTAISDAECALAQRRKDYAGFEHLADLPQHEEELQDARLARDEFAKLKKLIAEAQTATICRGLGTDLGLTGGPPWMESWFTLEKLIGHRVRLLLDDEAKG
jgi:hypothetical protein